jgi:hypothetical protein
VPRAAAGRSPPPQMLQDPAHRRHTDLDPVAAATPVHNSSRGRIWIVTYQPLHDSLASPIQARLLTTRVGLWGHVTRGAVLVNTCSTKPKLTPNTSAMRRCEPSRRSQARRIF